MHMQCANDWCKAAFDVSDADRAFYEKVSPVFNGKKELIPPPTHCPECRQQRRIAWRNERNLYRRFCNLCKREHVSIYSPDKPLNVLCQECWWSDRWDGTSFGRTVDFQRLFLSQWQELLSVAGLVSLLGRNNQNSEFVNQETDDKNCYLNAGGHYNEDCYYCTYSIWGKNNVDCFWILHSELCYECMYCDYCYQSIGLKDCQNCTECTFCEECTGCRYCFGCYGLKHKEYCFFNEQLTPEDYHRRTGEMRGKYEVFKRAREKARMHFLKYPHRAAQMLQCEEATGDYLRTCKNVRSGFLWENGHDLQYVYIGLEVKNGMDLSSYGWGELNYEIGSSLEDYASAFLSSAIHNSDCYYCFVCQNSDHLFGCIGLNRKRFCILNKQYIQGEYEALVPKIIEHMRSSGEWGEFFPVAISPFGYNETVALEYSPLKREEVIARDWLWKEDDPREFTQQQFTVPDDIHDVPDDIIDRVLACEVTGRNYRIIRQEFDFYKREIIPVPRRHPTVRHFDRLALQNPNRLWQRACAKCGQAIKTTYASERPEIVYCEECYLKEVY
jgi:hypothetical protein